MIAVSLLALALAAAEEPVLGKAMEAIHAEDTEADAPRESITRAHPPRWKRPIPRPRHQRVEVALCKLIENTRARGDFTVRIYVHADKQPGAQSPLHITDAP